MAFTENSKWGYISEMPDEILELAFRRTYNYGELYGNDELERYKVKIWGLEADPLYNHPVLSRDAINRYMMQGYGDGWLGLDNPGDPYLLNDADDDFGSSQIYELSNEALQERDLLTYSWVGVDESDHKLVELRKRLTWRRYEIGYRICLCNKLLNMAALGLAGHYIGQYFLEWQK